MKEFDPHPYGFYNSEGQLSGVETFDFHREDEADALWEIRVPGVDESVSWARPWNPVGSLEHAVDLVFPDHADLGLDSGAAAKIILRFKLVRGLDLSYADLPDAKREQALWCHVRWMDEKGYLLDI